MKTFTYYDYIRCIHTLRLNAVLQLAEESTEYRIKQKKENNRHDKLVKIILKDEKEMAIFINKFLEPKEKIDSRNLIKFTNSYITRKYKTKEADLVYQLKNQDIFFLVEHQSTVDYAMPYRILNYCIDIMQEWSKTKKIKRETRYPIIVPIVIYTGMERWRIPKNFKEKQISNSVFENNKIDIEYNLVEINKLSVQFLLKKRSLFACGMILEKSKNEKELKENVENIVKTVKDKKLLEEIKNIILYLLKGSIEESMQEELLEKIEIKIMEGESDMSSLYERLVNEFRQDIRREKKEGRKEGRVEVAKRLVKNKVEDHIIIDSTQITKTELENLKIKYS